MLLIFLLDFIVVYSPWLKSLFEWYIVRDRHNFNKFSTTDFHKDDTNINKSISLTAPQY